MKNTKWKKAIIGILVVTLIVATTMLLTGFSSAKEYGGVQNKIECQEVMDLGLNSGTLRLVKNAKMRLAIPFRLCEMIAIHIIMIPKEKRLL